MCMRKLIKNLIRVPKYYRVHGQTRNLGWGWNVPTQKLVATWDSTDPRRNMTILFSGRYDGGTTQGGYGLTLPPYKPDYGLDRPYYNKKVYADPAMRHYTGLLN